MDEADEVALLIAVLHGSQRTLPVGTPDLVQDGLETDAVFVDRPQFDSGLGESTGHLAQQRAQMDLEGGLRLRVRLHMAWARLEKTRADLSEGALCGLTTHAPTQLRAHPCGHRP